MKSKNWKGLMAALGFGVLILDSGTALEGMTEGVELCLKTLVPSLFPFFVLSVYVTSNLGAVPWLRPLGRLCGMPPGSEVLLLTGFLGGYPVGAENIAQAYRQGKISKTNAERLLAFCNNAGPSFLFGVVGPAFASRWVPWLLWGSHIIGALVAAMVTAKEEGASCSLIQATGITFSQALRKGISAMAQVCGWVVLFRMVIAYLQRWVMWMLPLSARVILCGILELANGCVLLGELPSEGLSMMVAAVMLGLGGCCVTLQTVSATEGLSLDYYFPGKILQCCVSALLAGLMQFLMPHHARWGMPPAIWGGIFLIGGFFLVILRKKENNSSISSLIGV